MSISNQSQSHQVDDLITPKMHLSIELKTKMENVQQKYFILEQVKQSRQSNHFIVEDLNPSKRDPNDTILYMKQMIFSDKNSFDQATQFYYRLRNYTQAPFSKQDIIKVLQVYDLDFPEDSYYELIIVCEFGESDRIDLPKIELKHITMFLKNLCHLLDDIKKLQNLYHGNLSLRNIILINNQLKLGGFKPIFSNDPIVWKKEINDRYGEYRVDLFMMGLLWIAFMGFDNSIFKDSMTLRQIMELISKQNLSQFPIPVKLLNLSDFPSITIEQVITEFQEDFILEDINQNKVHYETRDSLFDGFRGKGDEKTGTVPETNSNPFLQNFNQNSNNNSIRDSLMGNHPRNKNEMKDQYFNLDNFTLQEQMSVDTNQVLQHNPSKDEINFMDHLKKQSFQNFEEPVYKGNRLSIKHKNSEKEITIKNSNSEKQIKFAQLNSFKNIIQQIDEKDEESNLQDSNLQDSKLKKESNLQDLNLFDSKIKKESKNFNQEQLSSHYYRKSDLNMEGFLDDSDEKIVSNINESTQKSLSSKEEQENPVEENQQGRRKSSHKNTKLFEFIDLRKRTSSIQSLNNSKNSQNKSQAESQENVFFTKEEQPIQVNFNNSQVQQSSQESLKKEKLQKSRDQAEAKNEGETSSQQEPSQKSEIKPILIKDNKSKKNQKLKPQSQKNKVQFEPRAKTNKLIDSKPYKFQQPKKPNPSVTKKPKEVSVAKQAQPSNEKGKKAEKSEPKKQNLQISQKVNLDEVKSKVKTQFPLKPLCQTSEQKQKLLQKKLTTNMSLKDREKLFKYNRTQSNMKIPFKSIYDSKSKFLNTKASPNEKETNMTSKNFLHQKPEPVQEVQTEDPKREPLIDFTCEEFIDFQITNLIKGKTQNLNLDSLFQVFIKQKAPVREASREKNQGKSTNNIMDLTETQKKMIASQEADVSIISEFKELIEQEKYQEAQDVLSRGLDLKGEQKLFIYKMVFYGMMEKSDYKKAQDSLEKGLQYLEASNVMNQGIKKRLFKIQQANTQLKMQKPQKGLTLLEEKVFLSAKKQPCSFFFVKGDCQEKLKESESALDSFAVIVDDVISTGYEPNKQIQLYQAIERILMIHEKKNDFISQIKFYQDLQKKLEKDDFFPSKDEVNLFYLRLLQYTQTNHPSLHNYILCNIVDEKLLDFESLDDDMKTRYGLLFFDFFLVLSQKNKNKSKKFQLKYLKQSEQLLQHTSSDPLKQQKLIQVYFSLGKHYLENSYNALAYSYFEKCLQIYKSLFSKPGEQYSHIIFQIALALQKLKKYDQCQIYLEELIKNSPEDWPITQESVKTLIEIYYVVGLFQKCNQLVENFLLKNQETLTFQEFYRYFSFYFVTAWHSKSNISLALEKLKQGINDQSSKKVSSYFTFFYNAWTIYFKKQNRNENSDNFTLHMEKLRKTLIQKEFAENYLHYVSFLLVKVVFGIQKQSEENIYQIFKILDIDESQLKMLENLFSIIYFVSVNSYAFLVNYEGDRIYRTKLLEEANKILSNKNIRQNLIEKLNNVNKIENIYLSKTFEPNMKFPQKVSSSPRVNAQPNKQKEKAKKQQLKTNPKEAKNSIPETITKKWDLEKLQNCICFEQINNEELLMLIEQFLRQIKNLLFLNLTEKILEYFQKFVDILNFKKLDLGKFSYVHKLFNFYRENNDKYFFDMEKFYNVMSSVISPELCIHDYSMIIKFFESFKNARYLEGFVIFMNEKHSPIAHYIFRKLFFKAFFKKFSNISDQIMDKIANSNYFQIENTPLIHLLGEEVLDIEKEFTFHLYQRFRYYILVDSKFEETFLNYFTKLELQEFNLEWQVYNLVVNLVRKEEDSFEQLKIFVQQSEKSFQQEMTIEGKYFLKVLSAFYLVKFHKRNREQIKQQILLFVEKAQPNITDENKWFFALLISNISNLFFKNKLLDDALPLKKQSLAMAKQATRLLPDTLAEELRKQEFEMKSYDLMTSLLRKDPTNLQMKFDEFRSEIPSSERLKIEHSLIQCYYYQEQNDDVKFNNQVEESQQLLKNLKNFTKDLYSALLQQIILDKQNKDKGDTKSQQEKSRMSVMKVRHSLLEKSQKI